MAKKPGGSNGEQTRGMARAGRSALSRDRIVTAALALIERDGLASFSIRKLGESLGVEAMSVYHYFRSKRHLLDALVDHALSSVTMPAADLPAVDRLRELCYAYRAMARRFRALYPLVALHRLNTPVGVGFIEQVLTLVQAVVPDPEPMARQFRAMGYFLTGAALEETSGYARDPSAAEPVDDAYIVAQCPRLASVARFFKEPEWNATFEFGLEALIAGFRATAEAPRGAKPPVTSARRNRRRGVDAGAS